jgi:carboxylesterase type B
MAVNFRGGLPVVILLEGEGFVSGLVSRFPGQDLAAEGVIVVSVSYRLNVFGKSKWPQLAELILNVKIIQIDGNIYLF